MSHGSDKPERGNQMVYLKRGQSVKVMCDGNEIDRARVEMVDQSGILILGAVFASNNSGTFTLTYNPSLRGWTLFMAGGWTRRQPDDAVYQLEVLEDEPVAVTAPEGAD